MPSSDPNALNASGLTPAQSKALPTRQPTAEESKILGHIKEVSRWVDLFSRSPSFLLDEWKDEWKSLGGRGRRGLSWIYHSRLIGCVFFASFTDARPPPTPTRSTLSSPSSTTPLATRRVRAPSGRSLMGCLVSSTDRRSRQAKGRGERRAAPSNQTYHHSLPFSPELFKGGATIDKFEVLENGNGGNLKTILVNQDVTYYLKERPSDPTKTVNSLLTLERDGAGLIVKHSEEVSTTRWR